FGAKGPYVTPLMRTHSRPRAKYLPSTRSRACTLVEGNVSVRVRPGMSACELITVCSSLFTIPSNCQLDPLLQSHGDRQRVVHGSAAPPPGVAIGGGGCTRRGVLAVRRGQP